MTWIGDGATVLVTGGTGSFGSTMVRRLLDTGVSQVRVLSRDELKQHEMRTALGDSRLRFYLGDVRDYRSVADAVRGVDSVFHAAALKQVPSCEFFPLEAVRTNVLGSANVIEAAGANGVGCVVCLGTDKAVYPVNAMGMSKAMMEKTAQAYSRNNPASRTVVCTVRYGNVMHSRGSVIPLFAGQAATGRPMTVTDPDMTRFLMSLTEAVELVEHAFAHARQGDLFVRKAPAATVKVIALAVAEVLGVEPVIDVIGTRHGEKLFETLATREELAVAEDMGDYYRVPADSRDLNYGAYFEEGRTDVSVRDDYTSNNTGLLSVDEMAERLRGLELVQRALAGERITE